jgi:hypothetical protein
MQIRIRETGAVMYIDEFRRLNADTSFPQVINAEILNDFGADIVFEGSQASGGTVYQYSQESGVEQLDGKWYTKYILGPVFTNIPAKGTTPAKSAAEQESEYKAIKDTEQSKSVRTIRDIKLSETDWRFRSDMTPSQAWKDYCQELRDVPEQTGFPWTITWPEAPQ